MVACCLARYWSAHAHGGAFLWRVGGHDAEGRRAICLFAGSFLSALGFSLRLDAVSRDSDRDDRGRRGGIRALHGCACAVGFGKELFDRADSFWRLCGFALHRSVRRPGDDRTAHIYEHARAESRQARAKYFHDGKDGGADRTHCARHYRWFEVGRRCGELQRFLDATWWFAGSRRRIDRRDRIRAFRRNLRSADQFAFLRRRLEQHHLHSWRGHKSASQRSALACVRHDSGDRPLSARERRVSGGASFHGNPERTERPCRVGDGQRDISRRRRDDHGRRDHGFHLRLQ